MTSLQESPPEAMTAEQGATMHNYNNELVRCIAILREKHEEVSRQIQQEEKDKDQIQKDQALLTDRLRKITVSLARKMQARDEYDKTIRETESAYLKILESSQTLLQVLKCGGGGGDE
jgi:Sjoegren syndrome nuclear autoantigen 1